MSQEQSKKRVQLPDSPEALIELIGEIAREQQLEVYAVGGYIRDRLLGLPFSGEIDLSVVGDGPAFARSLAKRWGIRSGVQIYRRFGTARLQAGSIILEFATSRRESYSPDSRNPDVEPAPFSEDLARRDFTVNALAVDVSDPSRIIDHFEGLADLDARLLRTPLAPIKTFSDDPLRILRAIRFAHRLDFRIAEETWEAIRSERHRLEIVARSRINDEFFKILVHKPPSRGMLLLNNSGVMEVLFPEIAALAGVDQVGKHHHKDVLLHTFIVMDHLSEVTDDPRLLFAALLHDIGKPRTKRFEPEQGWTFHGHEHVGERLVKKMGKKYEWPDDLTERTSKLVRLHMRPINLTGDEVTDSGVRRLIVQAGDDIDDLLKLCRADITSANPRKVKRYLHEFDTMLAHMERVEAKDELRRFQSPIRGDEIMERTGLPEGPRVGLIKALIEEDILDGRIPFTREGADSVFDEKVQATADMPERDMIRQLKAIMMKRNEG